MSGDLNGDGLQDLAAGPYVYLNPGRLDELWPARKLDDPVGNILLTHDFDGDGKLNVLYTTWRQGTADPRIGVAWNRGDGTFTVGLTASGVAGDFPQGVAIIKGAPRGTTWVAISWHRRRAGHRASRYPVAAGSSYHAAMDIPLVTG